MGLNPYKKFPWYVINRTGPNHFFTAKLNNFHWHIPFQKKGQIHPCWYLLRSCSPYIYRLPKDYRFRSRCICVPRIHGEGSWGKSIKSARLGLVFKWCKSIEVDRNWRINWASMMIRVIGRPKHIRGARVLTFCSNSNSLHARVNTRGQLVARAECASFFLFTKTLLFIITDEKCL
jgi:hypothetical protein